MEGNTQDVNRLIPSVGQLMEGFKNLSDAANQASFSLNGLREMIETQVTVRTNKGNRVANIVFLNVKTVWVKLVRDGCIINRRYRDLVA
jgi:hypothetical protein